MGGAGTHRHPPRSFPHADGKRRADARHAGGLRPLPFPRQNGRLPHAPKLHRPSQRNIRRRPSPQLCSRAKILAPWERQSPDWRVPSPRQESESGYFWCCTDSPSLVTRSIASSTDSRTASTSYGLPSGSVYTGPFTLATRTLADWYSLRESAQYFSFSRTKANSK